MEVARGNRKLPANTLIINMGPAETCPAKKLNFCKIGKHCYAAKAEKIYKHPLDYRRRQYNYWKKTSAEQIIKDFGKLLSRIRVEIKYLRFNESGDFFGKRDVHKLDVVAKFLKTKNIITYGHTARKDLNFDKVNFLVKGSGHDCGNNGKTIVMKKSKIDNHLRKLSKKEKKYWLECPMSCKICDICKKKKRMNIIFPLH